MMRSEPKLSYCGLTIIMSNPSRMDVSRLLSGNAGIMMDNWCLRPEFNSMQCDIRLKEDTTPLLSNTKCILILGESAMHQYLPETLNNSLNEMRGSLFHYKGIPTICSYLPQDSIDIYKNYEKENNVLSADYVPDSAVQEDGEEDEGDVKALGKTKRSNYSFWLRADVRKCKLLLQGFHPPLSSPRYRIYPGVEECINILLSIRGGQLDLDLETDYENQNLQCVGFSFDGVTIYCFPVLDYNYKLAYGKDTYRILRALAIAIWHNTVVAHNGACFDFFVLGYKYRIPINKTYDTLIAQHRCFPDVEKSLGHGMSLWTWEKFHKDEDSRGYFTERQMSDRMRYCGKDVFGMRLMKNGMDKYIKTIPGLQKSIDDAMLCIRPYLISTLMGIKTNDEMVNEMCKENDRLMVQYNRYTEYFIGAAGMNEIRGGKKLGMFAGSNPQCCKYFHDMLGYPVVAKGKENVHGQRNPSLGKKALYKLALKHENPVINLICAYRAVKKETSRLRHLPWQPLNIIDTSSSPKSNGIGCSVVQ